jgi:hypothetical protein
LFSTSALDIVFAVSKDATVMIDITKNSITQFVGHPTGNHRCWGDVMALGDGGAILYVGYEDARCAVAYNVASQRQIWTSPPMPGGITSLTFHAGLVLIGVYNSDFVLLRADYGAVSQKLHVHDGLGSVLGHTVISGSISSG